MELHEPNTSSTIHDPLRTEHNSAYRNATLKELRLHRGRERDDAAKPPLRPQGSRTARQRVESPFTPHWNLSGC
ncbi:hypothetical protein M3J09_004974 [Ascochyta lentis]